MSETQNDDTGELKIASLPLLREDGSRLDWGTATYEVKIARQGKSFKIKVEHRLTGSEVLREAIADESALYVVDIRSPRTLYDEQISSSLGSQVIPVKIDEVMKDNTFVIASVVAGKPTQIATSSLHQLFQSQGDELLVPRGWTLAKAKARRVRSLVSSLITVFRDESLESGQINAKEVLQTDDTPKFRVCLAPDIYDTRRYDRDVLIAGLIGVFACMPNSSMAEGKENADHPVTRQLRDLLERNNIPDWNSGKDYEPAWAATMLERFYIKKEVDDDDDY